MKLHPQLLAAFLCAAPVLQGAIIVPGANGSDGPLNITTDTVIDLSKAITGDWDTNNAAHAGDGVYDPSKWAVVFKYTDVNIAAGATVAFKNHPSRAPVVWLVSESVTINGTVSLDGQVHQTSPTLSEPGPGGFRGGSGFYSPGAGQSPGFGVGGGYLWDTDLPNSGVGGSYGTPGRDKSGTLVAATWIYGNPSIVPLIGGSGGGGWSGSGGGGAGGGAILIAVENSVTVNGTIRANGGNCSYLFSGAGSGGAIRIITDSLAGGGILQALGGIYAEGLAGTGRLAGAGGLGRIRIERTANTFSGDPVPSPSVVTNAPNSTSLIWPPAGAPEVRIVSIGGTNVPLDPRAAFGTTGADVVLPQSDSVPVVVETRNVESASQIVVLGTPRLNGRQTSGNAILDQVVSTDPLVIRWTYSLPINNGYSSIQVKVVRP